MIKNKNIFTIVFSIVILGFALNISADDSLAKGGRQGIFVGRIEIMPSVIESAKKDGKELALKMLVQSLDTQLISALSRTGTFRLVERKRKSDLELEQGYAATAVNPNDQDAAQMGKMAGAKYVLLPQVDGFEDLVDTQNYKDIGRVSMARKLYVSVTATIVDTTTGEMLPYVPSAQLTQEQEVVNSRSKKYLQGSNSAIIELAKKAANELCQSVVSVLRPAKVLAVTGKQIMINQGQNLGFDRGLNVSFFAMQNVKDDDTGQVFANEIPVGQGYITRSNARQSYAVVKGDDLGIAKGCIVRIDTSEPTKKEPIPSSAPGGSFPVNPSDAPVPNETPTAGSSEKPIQFGTGDNIEVQDSSGSSEKPIDFGTNENQDTNNQ